MSLSDLLPPDPIDVPTCPMRVTTILNKKKHHFYLVCRRRDCPNCAGYRAEKVRENLKRVAKKFGGSLFKIEVVPGSPEEKLLKENYSKQDRKTFPGEKVDTYFVGIDPHTLPGLENVQVEPVTRHTLSTLDVTLCNGVKGRAISGSLGDLPAVGETAQVKVKAYTTDAPLQEEEEIFQGVEGEYMQSEVSQETDEKMTLDMMKRLRDKGWQVKQVWHVLQGKLAETFSYRDENKKKFPEPVPLSPSWI